MSQKISLELNSKASGQMESSGDDLFHDIKSIFELAIRRFLVISITAGLIFGGLAYKTFTQTPTYTSRATVIVDSQQTNVIDLGAVLSGTALNTAVIDTEVRVMGSKALLDKVAKKENLREEPEFNWFIRPPKEPSLIDRLLGQGKSGEEAYIPTDDEIDETVLNTLMNKVQVNRIGTTYLMEVQVTSTSPVMAARLANSVAEQYGIEQLETKLEATERATRWLADRVDVLQDEVTAKETLVEEFRAASGLLTAQGTTLTESNIDMLQRQKVQVEGELSRARSRYNSMRRQIDSGAGVDALGEVLNSPLISQLKAQESQARRKVAELESDLGPLHPNLRAARSELEDYQNQISAEVDSIIDNLRLEVEAAEDQIGSLNAQIQRARSTLVLNNTSQVKLNDLERDAEASRLILEEFVRRFKETREQDGLVQPDARVLSSASVPNSPSSPNTMLNLAIGVILGGICGVGLAVLLEVFNNRVGAIEEIERKFGVPGIGAVPLIRSLKLLGFGSRIPADFLVQNPLSAYAESMRYLRASIAIANMEDNTKTVTIASSLSDEGKTSLTLSLGRMSALSGESTLVIDGDFRRRQLTASAGLLPETGLVEYLLGECTLEEAIYREEHTGLDLLALSMSGRTLHDVFGTRGFDVLLERLKTMYDLILIDTGPLLLMAEAGVIASKTDKTILIVRWMRSRRTAIRRSLEMLRSMRADVLGVALNMVDLSKRRHHTEESANTSAYRKYYTQESRWSWMGFTGRKTKVIPVPPKPADNDEDDYDESFTRMQSLLNESGRK